MFRKPFKFKTLKFTDSNFNENVSSVLENEIQGIIIKNFLSTIESKIILDNYSNISEQDKTPLPLDQGFVYPSTIYSLNRLTTNEKIIFFKNNQKFNINFDANFKTSFLMKLNKVFHAGRDSKSFDFVYNKLENGFYPVVTFRELRPNAGLMDFHCEKQLTTMASEFYSQNHSSVYGNQLSFFCLLQKPNKGGDFNIFNLSNEEVDKIENEKVYYSDSKSEDINSVETFEPNLEVGDLIIFNGYNLYHRTKLVEGDKSRITLGGFLKNNGKDTLVWS